MMPRLIAHLRGTRPGPTLIVIGGMHGNEPGGIGAARNVLAAVDPEAVSGEVVALIGNLRASSLGRRYIAQDLNRLWQPEKLAAARALASPADEQLELVELSDAIDKVIARAAGSVHVVDLHTTSAAGIPFAVVGPTEAHRAFARALALPGVVGLEEALAGVLTRHYGQRGCVTLAIEGGQSGSDTAQANLEAGVTLALEASGVVAHVPGAAAAREHLARARGELPPLIEVVSRHAVAPEHDFRMEPGFANLQVISSGTLLARDRGGEIRAPFDGVVLLPLYQPLGEDGFFYGRSLS